jgi:predicted AlkP superfamily phosphohydrolase/phosphomutase
VSHMFWAYRDPKHPLYTEAMAEKYGDVIEKTYVKMDEIIGKVMQRLQPDDLLMIMSDHGFHSFRTEFSVNTWLVRNGYLAVKGQTDAASGFTDDRFLQGFDWANTRAYGLGLGMIFLNLQGREGQGTVSPQDAPALIQEIQEKLMKESHPETGEKVFRNIYTFVNPQGRATEDTPDIQLGYAEGYQTSKASAAGAAPKDLFAPNTDKWSGEHASSDVEFTHGILFSNRKLGEGATLLDLGVTAFAHLGAQAPEHFEGKSLLAE